MSGSHQHGPGPSPERHPHTHPVDPGGSADPAAGVTVADGVIELDTMLGGWERVTAGYLIEGDAPVLIETGSQSSVPTLLALLGQLGVGPADLAGVVVTHIHLDHAGGVGDVARAFPNATVYVHAKGARHLVDPTKLVDSAARVYGPLLDSLYGRLEPTPAERIHVLEDLEAIPVSSNRSLTAVDSPGHAKHHLALHDSLSGVLFAGDAVGVKLPDAGPRLRRTSTSPWRSTPCGDSRSDARPDWPWPTTGCSTILRTSSRRRTGRYDDGRMWPSRPSGTGGTSPRPLPSSSSPISTGWRGCTARSWRS
jgi:glyoxylase-like metal-dependent hydrolase (beta-lactamase superfamily II)